MSLNKYMHPRNPFYKKPPDFARFAQEYPEFAKHCVTTNNIVSIDFKDKESLRALCCILLQNLFSLKIDIPLDHLIPRVPQRINYALWLEDLLDSPKTAIGIDIGCGACCIYGLIICSMNKNWKMIVSDIDAQSIECAKKNVKQNNLEENILVKKVEANDKVLVNLISKNDSEVCQFLSFSEQIDFVMCNPPFFRNESEFMGISDEIRKPSKRHAPNSANPAQMTECVYNDDGEVGFVKRIVDESLTINKQIKVYTSMLGKKQSLIELKKYLTDEKKIENITESQFCQGHTMRWALAWSFEDSKLPDFNYFNPKNESSADKKSTKLICYEIPIDHFGNTYNHKFIFEYLKNIFVNDLKFKVKTETESNLKLSVSEKSWSNQRSKRRKMTVIDGKPENDSQEEKNEKLSLEFEFKLAHNLGSYKIELSGRDCLASELGKTRENLNQILQFIKNKISKLEKKSE